MKKFCLCLLFLTTAFVPFFSFAQPDISYYLPEGATYDPAIPTPQSIVGHEVGEYHISHDRLVTYMMALDKASDRISLEITGYTHEKRPLLLLTITSPKNHANIENIRTQHVQLSDPATSGSLNIQSMPAVFYMGFSIHGNEASGTNASLLLAYYLAAAQGTEIEAQLDNTIILFDPCFNPDGGNRFSAWVNSRKSNEISTDSYDMEHNEPWPGGRTNHYWFDLNRDWLVGQQPESQARIKKFHLWKPNVLTDHHEMGTNSSFFFQPGVPSRVHPLTPDKNQELVRKIGEFNAKGMDEIGSLYFTQEGYDDFYYGKGSTFPDVQGCIGILFEQASSRGHAQESVNGELTFPFTVRNQFTAGLSTLKAVNALRTELLTYQRDFYKSSVSEAAKDPVKALVFGSALDKARAFHLAEIVARQDIEVYKLASDQTINGKSFPVDGSYVVPMNQKQYRLIKGMFEKRTQFTDSIFYDISAWTLTLATGLDHEEIKSMPTLGEKVAAPKMPAGKVIGGKATYAYVFETYPYYAPRAMYRLLKQKLRIKVATDPFFHTSGKRFDRGAIMIPLSDQEIDQERIEYLVKMIAEEDGIDVYAFNTGLDYRGVSLGSNAFQLVKKPEIAVLVEGGVSATDAGEIWHLFDTRFNIPVTMMPTDVFNRADISKYNTIIFPQGSYNGITDGAKDKLKDWVRAGGVLIGMENAVSWFNSAGLGKFEMKSEPKEDGAGDGKGGKTTKRYADIDEAMGAQQTDGAIFEAVADLTHPLLYGYYQSRIPLFKGNNIFMEKSKNPYGNPLTYTASPLLSGYMSKLNLPRVKESAVAGVSSFGRGRVIGFTEDLCFRAFWFGTNKLLTNAIYYGPFISGAASR